MSRLAKHTPFGFLLEQAHQVAMLKHSTSIKHGRFASPHQLWNLLYILGKGTQCCIFGQGCLGSFPSLTGRLSISLSTLDSGCLFCIKWEFLLWTWLPAHERTVLHLQVKSRLGFKRFASVAELCEGLVVLIQAFFAFSKGQKHDTDAKKNSEVDKIVEPLSIRASCLGFPVIACSAEVV